MFRHLLLVTGLAGLVPSVRADDAIAPETVVAVKKSTVFVRLEGDGWTATGSGFVVAGDDKTLLIATNDHVAAAKPPADARGGKPAALSVVFDSGTKTERSFPATIAGTDPERDLAVLRVTGVKEPPRPIPSADPAKLAETLPVYTFGFPFGKALATDKGSPAITVGKASISSLRTGVDGELSVIQIDGNLNPGNSGGPVVDAKGKLVGVAVATIRDSQGIGLVIPAAELGEMMRGRVGRVRVRTQKKTDGPVTARVEVALIDPTGNLRKATAHYFVVAPKAKRPDAKSLDELPGSKAVALTVEKGVGVAEITLPAADGELLVQVVLEPADKPAVTTRVTVFPLSSRFGDVTGPPPDGWKEYAPADKTFVMWVPQKPARQTDRGRTSTVNGHLVRISSVAGRTADGLVYEGQSVVLPPAFVRVPRVELFDLFRGAVVAEMKGRITDSKSVTAGTMPGAEYVIEAGKLTARVRMYVLGTRVHIVQVIGSADQVTSDEAETILSGYRLPDAGPIAKGPGDTAGPPPKPPTVHGGSGAFVKEVNADGGLLVGLEIVVGDDRIRSVMPLYRVGKTEAFGTQFGTAPDDPITVKAKPGYAVGGITAKVRTVCAGFSLTFMKVVNGRLDPNDKYESEWVGWNDISPGAKAMSDGTPVVGLAVRVADKDVSGLGLLLKGHERANDAVAVAAPPEGKVPTIFGGPFDPAFKDVAPDGGLLVGFEIGTAKAFGHTMTRSAKPIFRVGGKESFGVQRGTQLDTVVTLKAKAGYAVGAISVMHGLGFDGLSVTFMKVTDGKLDPADSYESDYVGSDQKKALTKLGGDGTPVIGIAGRTNATDLTGMGLLFKGQEGYEPKRK